MGKKIRIGALISGSGTNLQAIIDSCESGKIDGKMCIRCKLISERYKVDSYIYPTKEGLLLEVKKHNPDVVFLDLNLYARVDGIKTSQIIQCQYNIPVMYIR